jgi:misacylated tRNA(Ala) deacylase
LQLLYQTDSYCRSFEAEVIAVDPALNAVQLSATAFYPGGGGQPCDTGILLVNREAVPVTKVQKGNWHVLDGTLPTVGTLVYGEIDWERRYHLMRIHTALHVLCGVVFRTYGALVTGGDMQPLQGRMDFEFERMQRELVDEIEARINAEVAAARDVRVQLLPREEAFQIPDLIRTRINLLPEGITEVRTVEIVGLDLQACGGTHLANTAEIGRLRISDYKSKGGINKRIYLEVMDAP